MNSNKLRNYNLFPRVLVRVNCISSPRIFVIESCLLGLVNSRAPVIFSFPHRRFTWARHALLQHFLEDVFALSSIDP